MLVKVYLTVMIITYLIKKQGNRTENNFHIRNTTRYLSTNRAVLTSHKSQPKMKALVLPYFVVECGTQGPMMQEQLKQTGIAWRCYIGRHICIFKITSFLSISFLTHYLLIFISLPLDIINLRDSNGRL